MLAVAARIGRASGFKMEPIEALEKLKETFHVADLSGRLDSLPHSAWDRLPNVLWFGEDPQLVNSPSIVAGLKRHLDGARGTMAGRALCACYTREFRPEDTAFQEIAALLRRSAESGKANIPRRWTDLHAELTLFYPERAPENVARQIVGSREEASSVALDCLGQMDCARDGRFGLSCYVATLSLVKSTLADAASSAARREAMVELVDWWLDPEIGIASPTIGVQVATANALLLPWSGRNSPSESTRQHIVELLLKRVGDPRATDALWLLPEAQESRQRFLSWLALSTIEQFFKIIDDTAEQRHWLDRRTFWAWYADRDFIADAWVAFGPDALRRARATSIGAPLAFGELLNARLKKHSVLLMRIGSLVIADYSHDGKCRFYGPEQWNPSFYESTYLDNDLRSKATDEHAHHMNWQARFASYIRRQTSVRSDYEWR